MKKLVLKLAIFSLLISLCQFLIVLKYPGIPDKAFRIRNRLQKNADFIYFGSSAVYWTYPKDKNGKTIGDYLHDLLPEYTIADASMNSGKMDLYLAAIQYMIRTAHHPKLVIIPIELRSFSPLWDRHTDYQYDREKFYFKHGSIVLDMLYRPLAIDRRIKPSLTSTDYRRSKLYNGDEYIGDVEDFVSGPFLTYSEEHLKKAIEARYMLKIPEDHHIIKDMAAIVRLLRDADIPVLFYITPIDHQTGEQYWEDLFDERIQKNIHTIQAALAKEGEQLFNIAFSLDQTEFTWRQDPDFNYMNEHLSEPGKRHVARLLVKPIEEKLAAETDRKKLF